MHNLNRTVAALGLVLSISAPQGDTPPVTPTAQPMGDANTTAPIVPPEAAGGVVDVPADDPTTMYAPGPTAIIVRACVDTNGDRRCTLGEGVAGLPVAVLDATSGDVRATATTNSDGRSAIIFTLAEQTRLSVDVVFLALGHSARPDARGTEIVLDAPVLPEALP